MKIQEQYPIGAQIQGTFHGTQFQAMVIGHQPAFPDQGECLDIDIVNPHSDLPIHRVAVYRNPWDYQTYENALCIDPIESKVIRVS